MARSCWFEMRRKGKNRGNGDEQFKRRGNGGVEQDDVVEGDERETVEVVKVEAAGILETEGRNFSDVEASGSGQQDGVSE